MSVPWSLRGRFLAGAALWTLGLFGLAIVTWHVTLGNRHPPHVMRFIFEHATLVAVICAACLLAGLLQVRRGWSPINQLRVRLARLDAGSARRLDGEYPSEVAPLVGDLNALLDQREESVARARASAGDLAHGLKTPLAILLQEAARAEAAGQPDLAGAIREQVERMRRQVDHSWPRPGPTPRGGAEPAFRHRWSTRRWRSSARCSGCTSRGASRSRLTSPPICGSASTARISTRCSATCSTTPASGRGPQYRSLPR